MSRAERGKTLIARPNKQNSSANAITRADHRNGESRDTLRPACERKEKNNGAIIRNTKKIMGSEILMKTLEYRES